MSEIAPTSAAEVRDRFAFFQGEALKRPVVIATEGQPETVLLSYAEFRRLKARDRQAYAIEDLPPDIAEAILGAGVPDELSG